MARSIREKKKKKAIQFQLGWSGLIALIIATVAALLWTFVLGFWIGQKLVGQSGPTNMVAGNLTNKNAANGALPGTGSNELATPLSKTVTPPSGELATATSGKKDREGSLETETLGNVDMVNAKKAAPPINKSGAPIERALPASSNQSTRAMESKGSKKTVAPREKGGHFVLQIASYRSKERAEREAQRWRKKGYRTTVKKANLGTKGIWYRIYLGQFKTVSDATNFARQFAKKEGLRSYVVPVK